MRIKILQRKVIRIIQKGDMPHFEIIQIMMGDPEVSTNLTFIKLCTLPFDLLPTNSIRPYDTTQNPPDTFSYNIPSQQVIISRNFLACKLMNMSQFKTYVNHHGNVSSGF